VLAGYCHLERVFEILLGYGYPPQGVDWLRKHRTYAIIALALLSWALLIGMGFLLWTAAGTMGRWI
jgi:hypothetical protein